MILALPSRWETAPPTYILRLHLSPVPLGTSVLSQRKLQIQTKICLKKEALVGVVEDR